MECNNCGGKSNELIETENEVFLCLSCYNELSGQSIFEDQHKAYENFQNAYRSLIKK